MAKSTFGFAVVLLAICAGVRAQQSPPTFRAGTTLVNFSVVVVDDKGNPVTDLRKDEISIVEDGSPRDVAFFQFDGAPLRGPAVAPAAANTAGSFSNHPDFAPGARRNVVAVVVDLINTSLAGRVQLQTEMLHYLKQIPSDAHVGLYVVTAHAIAIHDYTRDLESLRARLQNGDIDLNAHAISTSARDIQKMTAAVRPEQRSSMAAMASATARGEGDLNLQVMKWRRSATLQALESVGRHVVGVAGRKSLVWISHGFPLTDFHGTYTDSVTATAQLLASQNVAIYPLEAAGVPVVRSNPTMLGRIQGTGELMASVTGGRVTRNNNDLTAGVLAAASDERAAYSVGFYAMVEPDNRWHRLTVKVSRPGLIVRHRQGYLAAATAVDKTENWSEAQWNDVALRPLSSTNVRFDGRASFSAGTLRSNLRVHLDDLRPRLAAGSAIADLDIAVIERSATATTNIRVQSASLPVNAGVDAVVSVASEFALNPDTVAIRLIVRDKSTNRYGSADLTLAELPAK